MTKAQQLQQYFQSHEPGDATEALEMIGEFDPDADLELNPQGFLILCTDGSRLQVTNNEYQVL